MYQVTLTESLFRAIPSEPVRQMTIGDMLRGQAQAHGGRLALKELDEHGEPARNWTYEQLGADAERLARALAHRHAPGERIAVFANNLPEWALLEFAAALAGVTLVTVNPAYQERELRYVLEQSRAVAIYCVEEFRGNPIAQIAKAASANLPAVRDLILLTDHEALYAGDELGVLPLVAPHDVAQIQYTSGTTGSPKGALLHHHGLIKNSRDAMARLGVEPGDIYLHNMPLFHTIGCAILMLGVIGAGATLLLAPRFDPALLVKVIDRDRPGFLMCVPTMLVALTEEAKASGRDMSSVRRILCGGAMVAPDLVNQARAIFGATVQIAYGQTECSPLITQSWPDGSNDDLTLTIGQPMPDMDVAILDLASGAVVPIGEQGEICTRGYHVMTGYNDNPAATAAAIDADNWLHTGDLGRMDSRGFIAITGRLKEMIIRGGENLFPAEIENAMLEHDAVGEVAVVGVPCPIYGEEVVCFMRACGSDRPGSPELKAFIRKRLSPQKTPKHWIWVEHWPLTGSGKIQKFELARQYEEGLYRSFES